MALYEHIFIARQDLSAAQIDELSENYTKIIEEHGGKVEKKEYWGVKPLAYRINKNRKAHFTLFNVDGPHAGLAEVERQMLINEDILRFLTVSVDELDSEPSIMMQKRDEKFTRAPKRF